MRIPGLGKGYLKTRNMALIEKKGENDVRR
jgi:hypothetical protein